MMNTDRQIGRPITTHCGGIEMIKSKSSEGSKFPTPMDLANHEGSFISILFRGLSEGFESFGDIFFHSKTI